MKFKIIWIILVCFSLFESASAQSFSKSYHWTNHVLVANDGILLSDGNTLLLGSESTNSVMQNILVVKINSNSGDTIWSTLIHANNISLNGLKVEEASNKHIFIGANGNVNGSTNLRQYYITELDSSGNILQSKTYQPKKAYSSMYLTGMKVLQNQHLLTLGVSYDSLGMLIHEFDPSGTPVMAKSIRLLNTASLSIGHLYDVIKKDNAYYFIGNASYDGNSPDLIIMKSDTLGNISWIKSSFSGTMATLYIVSGKFISSDSAGVLFSLGTGVSSSLVKIDTAGNILSFKEYIYSNSGSSILQPYLKAIHETANGDLLISGITDLQMNSNIGTHVGRPFILKTDSLGNIRWSRKYYMANNLNALSFITEDQNKNLLLGGSAFKNTYSLTNFNSSLYLTQLDSLGIMNTNFCGSDSLFPITINNLTKTLRKETFLVQNADTLVNVSMQKQTIYCSESNLGKNADLLINISPAVPCAGSNAYITVSNAVNAGLNPTFNFYMNGVQMQSSNSPNYVTSILKDGDTITCEIISTASCVSPNSAWSQNLIAVINPTANPTISISANPSNIVTAGTSITFNASITNGGATPNYSWAKNRIHVGWNANFYTEANPQNGDTITCTIASSTCAPHPTQFSNSIALTVMPALGINVIHPNKLSIQLNPNPVSTSLNITLGKPMNGQLRIINCLGQICYSEPINSASIQIPFHEKSGWYILEIMGEGMFEHIKFVKE